jgi:hypothetical protein
MRRIGLGIGLLTAAVAVGAAWWRRHPRIGSAYVNRVVNPWLMNRGIARKSAGEIGLLEHVGRVTGTIHVSPVHPVPIEAGFRIVVPLGIESQWARNVMAAGHARIQIGDFVHEIDEPALRSPLEVHGIPPVAGHVMDWLGFRFLVVHEFAAHVGALDEPALDGATIDGPVEAEPEPPAPPAAELTPEPAI